MTVNQMTRHAKSVALRNGIRLRFIEGCTVGAYVAERIVHMIPITSEHWYAAVLHEMGHVALRHRHEQPRNWKEILAWKWARRAALRWTPEMEACAVHCLSCWGISVVDSYDPVKYLLA